MAKKIPLEKLNLLAMFDMVNDLSKSTRKNVVSKYNLFNFTTTDKEKEKILLYVRKANAMQKYWSCVAAKEFMEKRYMHE